MSVIQGLRSKIGTSKDGTQEEMYWFYKGDPRLDLWGHFRNMSSLEGGKTPLHFLKYLFLLNSITTKPMEILV